MASVTNIRHPFHAGAFYEESASSCRHHATRLLEAATVPPSAPAEARGGLTPHAGWVYSGALAALTFKTLAGAQPMAGGDGGGTFILLGADHRGRAAAGEVFHSGVWISPLGQIGIDDELSAALLEAPGAPALLRANPHAHDQEHSLEVQVPFIQVLCPRARIVPIAVPPSPQAVDIGRLIGGVMAAFPNSCIVGSTDLTHYGGHFGSPHGRGAVGERWARQNDQRMLQRIEAMDAEGALAEADEHANACGSGAVAAAIAACSALGASKGFCLEYTNSYEVVHRKYPDYEDETTVGYASVVFA
ncbi:MAG: AmmeMemoRadiSam system protein B [Planctomycetaceae bacterium]|nr:AmmeMemoRadiSam system protein B [Planctomycetaceae bacterium]